MDTSKSWLPLTCIEVDGRMSVAAKIIGKSGEEEENFP